MFAVHFMMCPEEIVQVPEDKYQYTGHIDELGCADQVPGKATPQNTEHGKQQQQERKIMECKYSVVEI